MSLLPYLHRVLEREHLSAEDARAAMAAILGGEATTAQVAAFLAALRVKGEQPDEIRGFAEAMRASAVRVEHGITDRPVLDTCGTGGDARGTLNVSTIVAFVVAGAGVAVAKHGNRSLSSQCGSADLLEALGVKLGLSAADVGESIREVGFGFLFAPLFHPAVKHAQPARAELKTRTVFNLLGPLVNPANATVQLVGAPGAAEARLMGVALADLGLRRGYVVHGHDGLDEVSTTGPTHLVSIRDGTLEYATVTPEAFGVERARLEDLKGGDVEENKAIALEVLGGGGGTRRDIVLVNASVALMAAGEAADYREGVRRAAEAIDSGAARKKLDQYAEFSRSH